MDNAKPLSEMQQKILEAYAYRNSNTEIAKKLGKTQVYVSVVFGEMFRKYRDYVNFEGKETSVKKKMLLDYCIHVGLISDKYLSLLKGAPLPAPVKIYYDETLKTPDKIILSEKVKPAKKEVEPIKPAEKEIEPEIVTPDADKETDNVSVFVTLAEKFNSQINLLSSEIENLNGLISHRRVKMKELAKKLSVLDQLRQEFE